MQEGLLRTLTFKSKTGQHTTGGLRVTATARGALKGFDA
jgi:hypothetical protein